MEYYIIKIQPLFGEEEGKIRIIEQFMEGKKSEVLCEDASHVSEDFVAVVDGVTSKSNFLYDGKTTGKLAAEIVVKVLSELWREADVSTFVKKVNGEIASFYREISFPYSKEEMGLQAVCAVYSDFRREIWMIGDCQVWVDGALYINGKRSDEILAAMRSLLLSIVQEKNPSALSGESIQREVRSLIEPWILQATVFANREGTEYGYSILNGEDIPESLIRVIHLEAGEHEVILASDGYPKVEPTLEQSEDYLKWVLKEDRTCCQIYKSTKGVIGENKSYDDRTYIRFLVEK